MESSELRHMFDALTPFDREGVRRKLAELAAQGVYIGTSSWKYEGWMGMLYEEARYIYRGRYSEARFNRSCLEEYAQVFKTVGVDAAYYQYPTEKQLQTWMDQVPSDFRFSFKVTDDITLKRFPQLPRFGSRAGLPNPDFLNAEKFKSHFLAPCERFVDRVGVLMFEFTRFHTSDFARGRDFLDALVQFLERLPKGWRYGVEIRNPQFLQPEYFSALHSFQVAHVLNSWEAMPPLEAQIQMSGVLSSDAFTAARLLLKPGRAYSDAVQRFSPYTRIQDPYPEVRNAAAEIIRKAKGGPETPKREAFIYVNNRLEGSALKTIEAILEQAQSSPG